ncbi:hypothetical protein TKO01_19500 [Tetragenococcus koreensis]|nr:hypothetical protein TKO01_19500 [Tetragenococcus koreensis]
MPSVIVEKTPFRIVAGLHTIALRPKTIEPLYLYYLIHSSTFRKYGYKVGTGMKVFGISKNNILKFETLFPCIEEQTKISSLLNKIDDTIALHQRKLDKLQELKKAALQSLFPQKEETEPKVRFANFSSPWKQRKFSDLLDPKKGIRRGPFGSALKKDLFVPESNYVVYEQQNAIYDRYNTRYNITEKKFKELSKFEIIPGDFIMSGAGTIGRISRVPKGIKKGVFNQALIRFKVNAKKIDSEYFLQLMRSDNMQRELTRSNPGSAMINLVPMSEVKKWKIKVPGFEEQREIGQFFSKLDNIVTLYQQKLEKQQNLKKAFLQKMFI